MNALPTPEDVTVVAVVLLYALALFAWVFVLLRTSWRASESDRASREMKLVSLIKPLPAPDTVVVESENDEDHAGRRRSA